MGSGKLSATIEFSEDLPGSEPLGETTAIALDAAGFHQVSGVGGSGVPGGTIDAERVRALLLENFDTHQLCALLDHLVRLRDLLVGTVADKP